MVCFFQSTAHPKTISISGSLYMAAEIRILGPEYLLECASQVSQVKWTTIILYHHITTTLDMEHLGTSLVIHGLL